MIERRHWVAGFAALYLTAVLPVSAQEAGKEDPPPPPKAKSAKSKTKKAVDEADKKTDDEGDFGAARKRPSKSARTVSDDKDREKFRKSIANRVPRKEKAIFIVKKVEVAAAGATDAGERRPSRTARSKTAGPPAGEPKVDFEVIAGRDATIDAIVEFMYRPKEPKTTTKKPRGKRTNQPPPGDDFPADPPPKRDWQIVRQFDDSKEKEATDYCAKLKVQQEARDRQMHQQKQRGQADRNFGDG